MKKYNVAVLGATGAVGREMIRVLDERAFPIEELRVLASARSEGRKIRFAGDQIEVRRADEDAFKGIDIVLGAVDANFAERFAPAIASAGAVFVDNSSAFRMRNDVPLVIPEINPQDVKNHRGIISNPNCSTIITLMALWPIARISPIKTLVASTYQAVSGAGTEGLVELENEMEALMTGGQVQPKVFSHQIAYNLIPCIGGQDDLFYTTEEEKLRNEGRKIMHNPDMKVTCTCVRVPVLRSHSISATFTTENKVTVEEARAAIAAGEGVKLVDDLANKVYPMPLDTSGIDTVYVGRIREDQTSENGLSLFCCGDQIRKGAAANAVQILRKMIQ